MKNTLNGLSCFILKIYAYILWKLFRWHFQIVPEKNCNIKIGGALKGHIDNIFI